MSQTLLNDHERERLAEVYHTSQIGRTTGMRIRFASDGTAICHWTHTRAFDHAMDQVHGGLIATLLDNAGWFTAAAVHGEWVVTSDFHVRLLRGTAGEDLSATAQIIRTGRRLTVLTMDVHSATGEHVATGSGSFCPTGRALPFRQLSDAVQAPDIQGP
ncbi:MAG: PaaI family thioesterase [Planctomycetota bacterium]